MKKFAPNIRRNTGIAAVMLTALGLTATGILAEDAQPTAEEKRSVRHVEVPKLELHEELEAHRIRLTNHVARFTVSVEVDYDRESVPESSGGMQSPIPGMGGPDMTDPFFRYDLGPFSGLVVGPNHIMISDRCLGEFNEEGPGDIVEAITVTLPNGERWPARVIGRHQQIDLALLELDCIIYETCPELEVIEFPRSDVPVRRGESVLVVGRGQNPLGTLANSGIVSALEREGGRAFQLDARIGNSTLGAPVVNRHGQLVGMVTLHSHQRVGQASGVSNAAYISEVRSAYELMKEGAFIPVPPAPFMGIGAEKKWPDRPGLEIGQVIEGTGAAEAGLRIGDVILSVNGEDMNEVQDLVAIIGRHEVGDTLTVRILRGEEERDIRVTLGPRRD
jgi:hypothetical protein